MHTYIKSKKLGILYISLLLVSTSFFACKKLEPEKYSGENFVYFRNSPTGAKDIAGNAKSFYIPVTSYSNLISRYQLDTILTNIVQLYTLFPLSIQTDGRLSEKDRKVSIHLEGDGIQYCVLPPIDSMYIPAGATEYKLNLKIARPPLEDTAVKTVTLLLKNNDVFFPEKHVWSKVTYRFGNWLDKPLYYRNIETVFGLFSAAKMSAIQTAVSKAGPSKWESDADLARLNNYLPTINQKAFDFTQFTLSELYYFSDITMFFSSGVMFNATIELAKKIKTITNAYLVAMQEAGTPVVDENGVAVRFP